MNLDERGIPVVQDDELYAPACPPNPCELCTGYSACLKRDGSKQTSWEWCQEMNTCGATVDWEEIYASSRW